jgi:hypothetical protein
MLSMSRLLALRLAALTPDQRAHLHRVVHDPDLLELVELVIRGQEHAPTLRAQLLEGAG